MTPHRIDPVIRLKSGELLDIEDGEGVAVTCVDGAIWVTQAHDPRDVVLENGESFVLDRPGLALVSAPAGAAAVRLRQAARPHRTFRPLGTMRSAA